MSSPALPGSPPSIADLKRQAESKKAKLQAERIDRELSRRHLAHFLARVTPGFVPGFHIEAMCRIGEAIEHSIVHNTGQNNRWIITMPPRHAKSQTFSRALPLWVEARNPLLEIMVGTYGQDLSDEHGDWAKGMVDNPEFQAVFPEFKVRKDSKARDRMITNRGGGMRYVGRGAATTGRGAGLIIIDDPFKDAEEARSETTREAVWKWFTAVSMTRLAPGGAIVVMHTRWHEDDLIGRILERVPGRYQILNFPAIATEDEYDPLEPTRLLRRSGEPLHPARFDTAWYDELRETLDSEEWSALYQQDPSPEDGTAFKREWFRWYRPGEVDHKLLANYVSCDLAIGEKKTNDYTAIAPFGCAANGGLYFYPDLIRARLNSNAIVDAILDTATRYGALAIIIENEKITMAILPLLNEAMARRGKYFRLITPTPRKDKLARAAPLQGRMQQGLVYFPTVELFKSEVVNQMLMFPNGKNDDVVDSLSWAANEINSLAKTGSVKPQSEREDEVEEPRQRNNPNLLCAWQKHEQKEPAAPNVLWGS